MNLKQYYLFNYKDKDVIKETSIELFNELLENNDYLLAEKFIAYTEQVYRYRFKYSKYYDLLDMVKLNNSYFLSEYNLSKSKSNYASEEEILKYNGIVTDFLIRVAGVSLIGASGTKIIFTSNDDLSDSVKRYLASGYVCYKMQKAIYVPHEYNGYGNFRFETPIVDIANCYIETKSNFYEKVLSKKR